MELELLTVFNALLNLREKLHVRPHFYSEELSFLSFAAQRAPLSNSQVLQDLWVLYELKEKRDGYFVEFGICDGLSFSNTLLLEKTFGWQGAVAEPARVWHDALYRNRNCYISDKCVHKTDGITIDFRESDISELSALEELAGDDFHGTSRESRSRYQVETISLRNFLREAKAPKAIDYLSIDIEGGELDVVSTFDFNEYDIHLISIEHNFSNKRQSIYNILNEFGYRRKFNALSLFDDWYVKIKS